MELFAGAKKKYFKKLLTSVNKNDILSSIFQ